MFQKHAIYLMASVPILGSLMACSSESAPDVDPSEKVTVQFRAYDVASRASLITGDNITGRKFAVWGDMVANANAATAAPSTLFNGTEVAYSGTGTDAGWKYDKMEYWMPAHTYSFVALCPSDAVEAVNYSGSQLSFDYTYPTNYADAEDILVSVHRRKYAFGKGENTVAFRFMHILSRLDFVANFDPASPAGSTITINSITLRGVGTQASFAIAPAPIASGASLGTSTDDINGSTNSLWTSSTVSGTIFTLNTPVTLDAAHPSYHFFPLESNPLMVIPQTLTDEVEVEVNYTTLVEGDTPKVKTAVSKLMSTAIAAHEGMWFPSRSYTYNFTVGADEIIIFATPVMEDWDESEGANFII